MIEALIQHCKSQETLFDQAKITILQENEYQEADFLTIGLLLRSLALGRKTLFITFRENYAHYLALSKKIGKSLEGFLKSKQLAYLECFESHFCSELPLVESQPMTYVPPPSLVHKIYSKDLFNQK